MDIKYKFQIGDHVKSSAQFDWMRFSGVIKSFETNDNNAPCYAIEPDNPIWLKEHRSVPLINGLPWWFEGYLELIEPVIPSVSCAGCEDML